MWLEDRVLLSVGPPNPSTAAPLVLPLADITAKPISIGSAEPGTITAGGVNVYAIAADADGRLIVSTLADSGTLDLRISLYDGQGNLLVQSDGQTSARQTTMIDQHVAAGNEYIEVQGLAGAGTYVISTAFTPSSDPGQTATLPPAFQEYGFAPIAVGDFTGNGITDIVAPDGVHLGTGDGTFTAPAAGAALDDPTTGDTPTAIAVGDFDGDHKLDAAVTYLNTDSVSIFLGNGDGTFQAPTTLLLPTGSGAQSIVAGDFLGNGRMDLAVADTYLDTVSIFLNNGDGTFTALDPISVGVAPISITAFSIGSGGLMDLAVADYFSSDVTVISNLGGGNFQALAPLTVPGGPAGAVPTAITAFTTKDGFADLAVTDQSLNVVDILIGDGTGGFTPGAQLAVGLLPTSIAQGDFGNGAVDLAVANGSSNNVSLLIGTGDGTFQSAEGVATGSNPMDVVAGDFNGDGRLDLATGNAGSNDISVLQGKGDGTFEQSAENRVGSGTYAVATGDFTGNGNLGMAILEQVSDSITILPGNGDGTFQQPLSIALPSGAAATSIVAADFNGDGRTDLAVAEPALDEVILFLGNGDGTFESLDIPEPQGPTALAAGDFTGNGRIDIAAIDEVSSTVTIILNNGNGLFTAQPPIPLAVSSFPSSIVTGNFNADGHLDLAVGGLVTDTVTILLGDGTGHFRPETPISLGTTFTTSLSLVAGDFLHNGLTDIAAANTGYDLDPYENLVAVNSIDVLVSNGDGTFQSPRVLPISTNPLAIVAGDFRKSGVTDLVTIDGSAPGTDDYSVYVGNGNGTFQSPVSYGINSPASPTAVVVGDFTGGGRDDLAISVTGPDDVRVELSNGDGTFSSPSVVDLVRRQTPVAADLNGDLAPDVSVVDAAGDILFRAGRRGEPGNFAPPVTVNPGDPSRDIAVVTTAYGPTIASVDANDNAISLFVLRASGFVLVGKLTTGSEPAQIISADLNGNRIDDLIVRNAGDGTISVFGGDGQGGFLPPVTLAVGLGASDIQVASLQQDGLLDIVYTNKISGEVGVLENLGSGLFGSPVLYHAGSGPYGVTGSSVPSPVTSLEGTESVTAGPFTADGLSSLVALNPGSNTFSLLTDLGGDRLANATVFSMPATGLVVRAIDFNSDGLTGVAILTPDGLYVYVSNGSGGFLPATLYNVGFEPNGLTVADLNADGKPDLLVSNPLGDVQILMGNGDGTFKPVQNLDQQVGLAVYAPSGTAPAAFIFSDQLTDQLIVTSASGVTTVLGDATTGLITPGAVKLADLNNNDILDLIVANSGSNNVLVYQGLGNGAFDKTALNGGHGFFTGTDPSGITVADVNGDGRPDLIIANKGSNNVSILINVALPGGGFTFEEGPRLLAGAGPVSTAVVTSELGTVTGLAVANSGSNNVWVLNSLGDGFFNDQSPTVFAVGANPTSVFVGQFSASSGLDLVTVNSGSNTLTVVSGFASATPLAQTISSGGVDPIGAFAVGVPGFGQDLVVANNGDGNIALFQPGENGLALSSVFASSGLPNPSGLALASFGGGNLEFYAANEGEASASLVGFQLEEGGATAGVSVSEAGGSAQLLSFNESSLALIGSLLTISLETTDTSTESSTAEVSAAGPGAAGQALIGSRRSPDEPEVLEDTVAQPAAIAFPELSWARYVMGLDQAIENIRAEVDARLLQEGQPVKAVEPDTSLREEDARVQPAVTTSFVGRAPRDQSIWFDSDDERLDAVDVTIGSWGAEKRASDSIFPTLPDKSLKKSPVPGSRIIEVTERTKLFPDIEIERSQPVQVEISRAVTLVAISAIAVKGRQRLRRSRSAIGAGSARSDRNEN